MDFTEGFQDDKTAQKDEHEMGSNPSLELMMTHLINHVKASVSLLL